jgi:hypothetical protein
MDALAKLDPAVRDIHTMLADIRARIDRIEAQDAKHTASSAKAQEPAPAPPT